MLCTLASPFAISVNLNLLFQQYSVNSNGVVLQVEKCKTVVRECVKFCEDAEGDKAISKDCYDSDGELPERHIFCAKCHTGDSQEVSQAQCMRYWQWYASSRWHV